MVVIGRTVDTLVTTATAHASELGGRTVSAYSDKYFSTPLKETMFSLGIKKIEIGPRIITENSDGTTTTTKNRKIAVRLALNVYAPHEKGGEECGKGFDRWMDFAVRTLQLNISDAGCQEVEYDQSIGTNVLKGYFTLTRITSDQIPLSPNN